MGLLHEWLAAGGNAPASDEHSDDLEGEPCNDRMPSATAREDYRRSSARVHRGGSSVGGGFDLQIKRNADGRESNSDDGPRS
jgi:hypothetical protein